jgi:hypothetical protein
MPMQLRKADSSFSDQSIGLSTARFGLPFVSGAQARRNLKFVTLDCRIGLLALLPLRLMGWSLVCRLMGWSLGCRCLGLAT